MSRPYVCDQCETATTLAMPFDVKQITDDEDSDGNQIIEQLDLCSVQCLVDYAVGQLDMADDS